MKKLFVPLFIVFFSCNSDTKFPVSKPPKYIEMYQIRLIEPVDSVWLSQLHGIEYSSSYDDIQPGWYLHVPIYSNPDLYYLDTIWVTLYRDQFDSINFKLSNDQLGISHTPYYKEYRAVVECPDCN